MSDESRDLARSTELAKAARLLRRDLEAALAEAHREDPLRAAPNVPEVEQVPGDWRDAEIARLREELAESAPERAERDETLSQARAERDDARAALATALRKKAAQDETMARLRDELAQVRAKVAALRASEAEAARLRVELETVLGSASWRLTSPLRGALDRLRGRRPPA